MCVETVFHRAASETASNQRSQHNWCSSPVDSMKLAPLSTRRCSSVQSIVIGAGCNSVVFKCTDEKTGETFALKQPRSLIAHDACRSPQGQKDSRMLQNLRHENVVQHRSGCESGMLMEFLDGGSLLSVMERAGGSLNEEQVSALARQIVSGVAYIHSKNIVHRDIKPANVFFDCATNTAKVGDIAVASETASSQRNSGIIVPVGTPAFLAPEVVRTGNHSFASDIWAVGCSVLQLISGRVPWDEEDTSFSALFKIGNGQHPPIPNDVSENLRSLLEICFQPADSRPSAADLLSHPFLANLPPAGPLSP